MQWIAAIVTGLLLIGVPLSSQAIELFPFASRNQSPVVKVFGLPPAEPAALLEAGQISATLSLDIANNYTTSATADEFIILDGESYSSNLGLRYGVSDKFEIGIDLPFLGHAGGFLDSFIEGWHDTFGLPDGGRKQTERDQLRYSYIRNGRREFKLDKSVNGIGDIRLTTAWQLVHETGRRPGRGALRIGLKLPTGDSDKLLGSGSTDLSVSLAGQREYPLQSGRVATYASLGALLMTDGEILAEQRNLAGFGSFGVYWAPLNWMALKIQADGHTALYKDSDLTELESSSVQLLLGGSLQVGAQTTIDIAVSEDVVVDTSPDVNFHLALRTVF